MNQEQLDRIEAKLDLLLERTAPKAPRVRKDPDADPVFDQFWRLYPVKKGKQAAQRAWKNKKAGANIILKDIQVRVLKDRQWIEGFVPHAATYLNGCRWEDEIQAPKAQDSIPRDNDEMYRFAIGRGYREPHVGEDWFSYRKYVESKVNG